MARTLSLAVMAAVVLCLASTPTTAQIKDDVLVCEEADTHIKIMQEYTLLYLLSLIEEKHNFGGARADAKEEMVYLKPGIKCAYYGPSAEVEFLREVGVDCQYIVVNYCLEIWLVNYYDANGEVWWGFAIPDPAYGRLERFVTDSRWFRIRLFLHTVIDFAISYLKDLYADILARLSYYFSTCPRVRVDAITFLVDDGTC